MRKFSKKFKTEKLTEATQKCAKILIPLMQVLEIPNFVESKIMVNNTDVYKLRIEKVKKKPSIFKRTQGRNFYFVCKSFLKIIDSIMPILTLGFYWTDFEYRFTKWNFFKK